jgi:hypothetical protein
VTPTSVQQQQHQQQHKRLYMLKVDSDLGEYEIFCKNSLEQWLIEDESFCRDVVGIVFEFKFYFPRKFLMFTHMLNFVPIAITLDTRIQRF